MTYPTKKDAWLVLLVTAAVAIMTWKGIDLLGEGKAIPAWTVLGSAALCALVFYSFAEYEVTASELIIRSQLYRVRFGTIPLASIEAVTPTRNPLSAPAWSLDRLRIDYRTPAGKPRFNLISPRDRAGFLRTLAQRAPHLELQGEALGRRAG